MGRKSDNRLHPSSGRPIYQGRSHHSSYPRLAARFTERTSSGMRMVIYFINRAGRSLSASRRAELESAKTLLSKRIRHSKTPHTKAA